jgi:hypothetical protein
MLRQLSPSALIITVVRGMDIRQSAFTFINIVGPLVAAYFFFRKNPRESIRSGGPLFLVCVLPFLGAGISTLPVALPIAFERLLGHSVWMNYMPPLKMNVTQVGGTWWVVRWKDPIQEASLYVLIAALLWATVNVVQRRARKLNCSAFAVAFLWVFASFVLSLACFPFCL